MARPNSSMTTTSVPPAAWAGEVQVICVEETAVTAAASAPPTVTRYPERKFVPPRVRATPPPRGLRAGPTEARVGVAR